MRMAEPHSFEAVRKLNPGAGQQPGSKTHVFRVALFQGENLNVQTFIMICKLHKAKILCMIQRPHFSNLGKKLTSRACGSFWVEEKLQAAKR